MNRKLWIVAGIVVTVLLVVGIAALLNRHPTNIVDAIQSVPALKLDYCAEEQVKPCVVSFSTDINDNMLVNILLPDISFPNFYLKIVRGDIESTYDCQKVREAVNNAYCIGEKIPPGEILHLKLISVRDAILLAEGDLSIIGLAYPTLGVAVPTLQETPTVATEASTPTHESPTQTPLSLLILPTSTETLSSYPNPSYPNSSYP